ncbi:1,4-dihydroxy-2-naphthoate polyprenyltransferase [Pseudolysinimonas sp.]|uniref:1,4-dihydroxy-2-naphthoate polyprenyltransferase n=1 Tax=Pseudolysinimonas sp. TaxID=2680009 RepID=UPI0037CB3CFD
MDGNRPVPPKAKVRGAKLAAPKPATLGTWIAGARPLTLVLAIVPVALGTAAAAQVMANWYDHWVRALLCLAVAVFLQIGVNYANDYSDGVRGTDRDRVGPQRLVGSGRAKPRTVLIVALVFFALAAVAGGILVWRTEQWWLLAVGAVCQVAGWFYTGGRRPYGYLGLGELAVFVFFGIVPTAGTMFVQVLDVNIEAWLAGAAAGAFAAAVLVANNARDRERDKVHGKRTLAVLLGSTGTRILYLVLMLVPFGILAFFALFYEPGSGSGFAPYVYFAGVAALPAILIATTARTAREWVVVMQLTLVTSVLYGLGLAAAIVLPGALL